MLHRSYNILFAKCLFFIASIWFFPFVLQNIRLLPGSREKWVCSRGERVCCQGERVCSRGERVRSQGGTVFLAKCTLSPRLPARATKVTLFWRKKQRKNRLCMINKTFCKKDLEYLWMTNFLNHLIFNHWFPLNLDSDDLHKR